MSDGLVKILDGNTFVVSDERGDIEASLTDPTGLFSFDTRFLSRWVLTVERRAPERAVGRRPPVLRDALLPRARDRNRVHRREAVGDPAARGRRRVPRGAHDPEPRRTSPSTLDVRIDAGCDFADLFEVKDALKKKGTYSTQVGAAKLVLGYERGPFRRATRDLRVGAARASTSRASPSRSGSRRTASGRPSSTSSRRCSAPAQAPIERYGPGERARRTSMQRDLDTLARRGAAPRVRLGRAAERRTTAASSTSPRCASRRRSPAAAACPRPACRGS